MSSILSVLERDEKSKRARDVYSAVVDHRLSHGWKEAVQSGAWLWGVRHMGGICWGWVREAVKNVLADFVR